MSYGCELQMGESNTTGVLEGAECLGGSTLPGDISLLYVRAGVIATHCLRKCHSTTRSLSLFKGFGTFVNQRLILWLSVL